MKLSFIALILAIALFLPALAGALPFPPLKGECLSGRQADLPAEAGGLPAVIIMTFNHGASESATRWGKALDEAFKGASAPAIYQIAQIEAAPFFVRPLILRSLRKKCDAATRDKIIILKSNTEAWIKTAAYDKKAPDDAYILLLDKNGEIIWTAHSSAPGEALAQLRLTLAAD